MKTKSIAFVLILTAAAFYAGRRSAPPAAGLSSPSEESHAAREELTLPPEIQRKAGMQFAAAEIKALPQVLTATGSVQANASRLAQIRALARGRIDAVHVRLGDRVEAGQPLVTYDNFELGDSISAYLSALVELRKAEAGAQVSRRAMDRARNLAGLGAVAAAELLRREAEYKDALAAVESRKAELARIEEKLHRFGMTDDEIARLDPGAGLNYHRERSHSTLRAPFAGVVIQLGAVPGETAGIESALATVADLSTVWVQADIYERDIHLVQAGRPAEVEVASYPGRGFPGKVTHIGDSLDPATRTAKVRVEVSNPDGMLKLEMFAVIRIPIPASRPALAIPAAAIQYVDGTPAVFVQTSPDRFEMRSVELGLRAREWVEVLRGVEQGDRVVTEGSFLLKSEWLKHRLGHHEE
ncbi:MAG: efflux RND transporter periplasmic adaptor subunit [Bryobacteraceae bacterium]|nr:efflux RND transporter periplasmic adaptor subunit [Bryobacteraceae bacterium]